MKDFPLQDFWLTRDRSEGVLSDDCEVWLHKPDPIWFADGDVTWIAPLGLVDRAETYAGTMSVVDAKRELGSGVPVTERECLYVGRTPRAQV